MKMFNLFLSASLILTSAVFAQTDVTTSEINAQTAKARSSVNDLLLRVNSELADRDEMSVDYYYQQQDFKKQLEERLKKFDDMLVNQVFTSADYWMHRYNSLATSGEYAPELTKELLDEMYPELQWQFSVISMRYQLAISQIYNLVKFDVWGSYQIELSKEIESAKCRKDVYRKIDMKIVSGQYKSKAYKIAYSQKDHDDSKCGEGHFTIDGKPLFSDLAENLGKIKDRKLSFNYKDILTARLSPDQWSPLLGEIQDEVFKNSISPAVRGTCESKKCEALRAQDFSKFLSLTHELLDRKITFKLADGKVLELAPIGKDIGQTLQELKRFNSGK